MQKNLYHIKISTLGSMDLRFTKNLIPKSSSLDIGSPTSKWPKVGICS